MAPALGKRGLCLALAALFAVLLLAGSPSAVKAAFFPYQPGLVEVNGYAWTANPVKVELEEIAPTDGGATTYTVRDILENADSRSGQFNVDTVPGVEITLPGAAFGGPSCTGDQMRAESASCPLFSATDTYTEMSFRKNGQTKRVRYKDFNPEIYISKPADLSVTLTPAAKTIESGETVTFKAKVTGANGTATYNWDFGDGASDQTTKNTVSHRFTGNDEQFSVILNVTVPGQDGGDAAALITVGKVKKEKPKEKDKSKDENDSTPEDSGTYDPGYVPGYDDYDDGTGTGGTTSGSTPSPSNRQQPEKQQPAPVEQSGDTVTGQLIDPTQIATVVPSTETPATGTEEAAPGDDSKGIWGSIPNGAKAAFGIGALLGLGGLAEAGAFSGAFRRFRYRF